MRREQSYTHSAVQYRHDTPYEPDLVIRQPSLNLGETQTADAETFENDNTCRPQSCHR
jgi:hypothetical protein